MLKQLFVSSCPCWHLFLSSVAACPAGSLSAVNSKEQDAMKLTMPTSQLGSVLMPLKIIVLHHQEGKFQGRVTKCGELLGERHVQHPKDWDVPYCQGQPRPDVDHGQPLHRQEDAWKVEEERVGTIVTTSETDFSTEISQRGCVATGQTSDSTKPWDHILVISNRAVAQQVLSAYAF